MDRRTWQLVRYGILLAIIVAGLVASQRSGDRDASPEPASPPSVPSAAEEQATSAATTVFRGMTIRDLEGDIAYQGDVDLSATLERIDSQRRLKFRNDGSVFENREKRLPANDRGYYREWVHPTPELSGPGPQRVVTGADGEAYYTPDHYRTFHRIR